MPDGECTATDQMPRHGPQVFVYSLLLLGRDICFAPTMQSVIRLDAAEQQVPRRAGVEQKAFDTRDLHLALLLRLGVDTACG